MLANFIMVGPVRFAGRQGTLVEGSHQASVALLFLTEANMAYFVPCGYISHLKAK